MAGLPVIRAIVWVGPPLSWSGPRIGSMFTRSPVPVSPPPWASPPAPLGMQCGGWGHPLAWDPPVARFPERVVRERVALATVQMPPPEPLPPAAKLHDAPPPAVFPSTVLFDKVKVP